MHQILWEHWPWLTQPERGGNRLPGGQDIGKWRPLLGTAPREPVGVREACLSCPKNQRCPQGKGQGPRRRAPLGTCNHSQMETCQGHSSEDAHLREEKVAEDFDSLAPIIISPLIRLVTRAEQNTQ